MPAKKAKPKTPVKRKKAAKQPDIRLVRRGVSKKAPFLAAFRRTASVRRAAAAVKIDRTMHYRWLAEDPTYAAAFEKAREEAAQVLEDEAVRRAYEGIRKPVFYQGEVVDYVFEYDTALLMFLLRGWRPDRYRERTELTGPDGGPIEVDIVDRLKAARKRLASAGNQPNAA